MRGFQIGPKTRPMQETCNLYLISTVLNIANFASPAKDELSTLI